jgi:signal transduction histidine kinase
MYSALNHAQKIAERELYAREINTHRMQLAKRLLQAMMAFPILLDPDLMDQQRFQTAVNQVKDEFASLHQLVKNDKVQSEKLSRVENTVLTPLNLVSEAMQAMQRREILKAVAIATKLNVGNLFKGDLDVWCAPYQAIEKTSMQSQATARRQLRIELVLAIFADVVLSLALYIYFSRDTSRRLERVLENTLRFSQGETLNPQLAGKDEIAHLDRVFHVMADSITRAAQEKEQFMAMVAHDIRAPLSSLSGSLELLSDARMETEVSSKARSMIGGCIASSERLMQIINDLLEIEKLEAGKLQMHFEQVPLAYVLECATNALRGLAAKTGISLSIPDTEVDAHMDGDRMSQVMMKLLSNAIARSPGGGNVRVSLEEQDACIRVNVIDNGPPLSPDRIGQLFEKFQTSEIDGSADSENLNLELALCKQIIASHHGAIGAESSSDKGTTFWFSVPIGLADQLIPVSGGRHD